MAEPLNFAASLLRDPLSSVTRDRQKIVWVAAASSLLLQLGALTPDINTHRISIFGFLIHESWGKPLSVGTVIVTVVAALLFGLSAFRDYKALPFLTVEAWQIVWDSSARFHDALLRGMRQQIAILLDDEGIEFEGAPVEDLQRLASLKRKLHSIEVTGETLPELNHVCRELTILRIRLGGEELGRSLEVARKAFEKAAELASHLETPGLPGTGESVGGFLAKPQGIRVNPQEAEGEIRARIEKRRIELADLQRQIQEDEERRHAEDIAAEAEIARAKARAERKMARLQELLADQQSMKTQMEPIEGLTLTVRRLTRATAWLEVALPLGVALIPILLSILHYF